jgi:hypothetical protein
MTSRSILRGQRLVARMQLSPESDEYKERKAEALRRSPSEGASVTQASSRGNYALE